MSHKCIHNPSEKLPFWKIIAKVRAAVHRVGFNLWDLYRPLDSRLTNVLPESKFLSVLAGPLQDVIGLCDVEIKDIIKHFQLEDGFVMYAKFCEMVHNSKPDPKSKEEARLWDVNVPHPLTKDEENHVLRVLTQIAIKLPQRLLEKEPLIQKLQELNNQQAGIVLKSKVKDVYKYLKLGLNELDFKVLFKKFQYDHGHIKYQAFMTQLYNVYDYLATNGLLDKEGKYVQSDESTELPRVELEPAPSGPHYGIRKIFLPSWNSYVDKGEIIDVIRRIQRHVNREFLRIGPLFHPYDEHFSGRIDAGDFCKVLGVIQKSMSGKSDLYLCEREKIILFKLYEDDLYEDRILWKVFVEDIERDFDKFELERWPQERKYLKTLIRNERRRCKEDIPRPVQTTVDDLLNAIAFRCIKRNLPDLSRAFSDYGRHGKNTITIGQFVQGLIRSHILLNEEEIQLLQTAYKDSPGIVNFEVFLADVVEAIDRTKKKLEGEPKKKEDKVEEPKVNIIEVLAHIRRILNEKRVRLMDIMKQFDHHNSRTISESDFCRGLATVELKLSESDICEIIKYFKKDDDPTRIKYVKFCDTVDEANFKPPRRNLPLAVSMAQMDTHKPRIIHQFVNFKERAAIVMAIGKLSKKINIHSLMSFKEQDSQGRGTITRSKLINVLNDFHAVSLLSNKELDAVIKGFGTITDRGLEIDYISFLHAIDVFIKKQQLAKR